MIKLGNFKTVSNSVNTVVDINILKPGVNSIKNHFIVLDDEKNVLHVIDKICDHAGGRLIHKGDNAVCPMHGWKLDLHTLKYQDSHIEKSSAQYSMVNGKLLIPDNLSYLENPYRVDNHLEVNFRFLNHATVAIFFNEITLITDPWLFGPAFMTGWWLDQPSTEDSIEILQNADYIFISHNHPDHLHSQTLELLKKDQKFIVGNFNSKSTEKYLKSLGFINVDALEFNSIYQISNNFNLSILKSGDFRDDSGLYINLGGIELLLTVDANILNSLVLPRNIDLLMTSFAGGASGFPLCFDNYDLDQKLRVIQRNKLAIKASVIAYIKATQPKYYMPYAGMFQEKAERDSFIKINNSKNSPKDYEDLATNLGANYIDPQKNILYKFRDKTLSRVELNLQHLPHDNTDLYIYDLKNSFKYNSDTVIEYMRHSGFKGKQIVYILPSNDDFTEIINEIVYCNFDAQIFEVVNESDINLNIPEFRTMKLLVRQEVFASIITNKLPWEDFSIGFQMRIERDPNSYEADFWYHFTNVYIDPIHYKFSPNCGTCNLINQNPIFLQK